MSHAHGSWILERAFTFLPSQLALFLFGIIIGGRQTNMYEALHPHIHRRASWQMSKFKQIQTPWHWH